MAKVTGADTIVRHLRTYDQRYRATVRNVIARQAEVIEERLKTEAPWQDRTGDARAGLEATPFEDSGVFRVVAKHGVPYGVFLEVAHQGRFAVLQPVMRTAWPRAVHAVARSVKEIKAT